VKVEFVVVLRRLCPVFILLLYSSYGSHPFTFGNKDDTYDGIHHAREASKELSDIWIGADDHKTKVKP
jgi:hypothetical protein